MQGGSEMLQLYKNIKNRRNELHLTQSELADKMGYADKSMIAKIEKGLVDLPQSKIFAFAKALETTPSYLMGWEPISDEDIANVFVQDSLEDIIDSMEAFSPKEKTYFKKYLQLIEINRLKADKYVDQLLSIQDMEADLALQAAHERTDIKVTKEMKKHDDNIMNDDSEWE